MILRCGGKLKLTPDSCDKHVKRRSNLGTYGNPKLVTCAVRQVENGKPIQYR